MLVKIARLATLGIAASATKANLTIGWLHTGAYTASEGQENAVAAAAEDVNESPLYPFSLRIHHFDDRGTTTDGILQVAGSSISRIQPC